MTDPRLTQQLKQLATENAKSKQTVVDTVGKTAPMAEGVLSKDLINRLVMAINEVKEQLGDGQVPPTKPVTRDMDQLPPEIYTDLVTMQAFLKDAGLRSYQINASDMATSDEGLSTAAAALGALARNEDVLASKEMAGTGTGAQTVEPVAPSESPGLNLTELLPS